MDSLVSWRVKGHVFTFDKQQVFYVDEGSGVPIVLLHGYPTASYDWHYIWEGLKVNHRLIAPDFIGFGFSAKPVDYAYSIHKQTDMVVALLKELGISEFHLVAHDYAVSVAQELIGRQIAKENTLTIQTVCLLNGGLFPELHRPVLTQKLLLSPLGGLVAKLFTKKRFAKSFGQVFAPANVPNDAEMEAFWQLIQHNGGQKIIHKLLHYIADRRQHRSRWVHAITEPPMPVLLINGLQDPVSGRHLVEGYRQKVKEAHVVEIADAGHYPQVEKPNTVLKAILQWGTKPE
jgi:pimeloyl-ACP methyl ester carboxylesterase